MKKYLILILSALTFFFTSCTVVTNSDKVTTENREVELQKAKSVDAAIHMGAGELTVDGGSDKLMKGEFRYSNLDWKPEIDYNVNNGIGNLQIAQPSKFKSISLGKSEYKWNIKLNNSVPVKIDVEFGAGECKLDLSSLNLQELQVDMGAGEVTIDLSGDYKSSFNAEINGGVGKSTLYLPKNIGVKVNIEKGIGKLNADGFTIKGGDYVNEAYGDSTINIEVDIKAGIGEINLVLK